MLFSSLTRRLGIPPRPTRHRPKPSFRPHLEALEERVVPAAVLGKDLSPSVTADVAVTKASGGTTGYSPSVYTSYESIRSHLQSLASDPRYAGLVKLERIGEGAAAYNDPTGQETHRGLWAIKISDNASVEEAAEPDVKYIGNMHGNEPLSMQMCMGFIDDLLTRYATDSGVQDLVNNNEIKTYITKNFRGVTCRQL